MEMNFRYWLLVCAATIAGVAALPYIRHNKYKLREETRHTIIDPPDQPSNETNHAYYTSTVVGEWSTPIKVSTKAPCKKSTKTPDDKSPDEKSPDEKSPDEKSPDEKSPDEKSPDEKSPDATQPREKSADLNKPDKASTKAPCNKKSSKTKPDKTSKASKKISVTISSDNKAAEAAQSGEETANLDKPDKASTKAPCNKKSTNTPDDKSPTATPAATQSGETTPPNKKSTKTNTETSETNDSKIASAEAVETDPTKKNTQSIETKSADQENQSSEATTPEPTLNESTENKSDNQDSESPGTKTPVTSGSTGKSVEQEPYDDSKEAKVTSLENTATSPEPTMNESTENKSNKQDTKSPGTKTPVTSRSTGKSAEQEPCNGSKEAKVASLENTVLSNEKPSEPEVRATTGSTKRSKADDSDCIEAELPSSETSPGTGTATLTTNSAGPTDIQLSEEASNQEVNTQKYSQPNDSRYVDLYIDDA